MDTQLELAHFRLSVFQTLLNHGLSPVAAISMAEKVYEAFYLGNSIATASKRPAKKR